MLNMVIFKFMSKVVDNCNTYECNITYLQFKLQIMTFEEENIKKT